MAENKQQKSNIGSNAKGMATLGINKIIVILTILAFLLLAFQVFSFIGSYSKKTELMMSQGRIINIDPKSNKLELTDISEQELQEKRNKAHIEKIAKGEQPEELVGPMPKEITLEEMVGPMPASDALVAKTEEKPAKVKKPVDYNTANLSIIVTEIGPINENLELARTLPLEVTFAFSPYTDDLKKKLDLAAADGRTSLLNLMMQPSGFPMKDNGPMSIQVNYDENENIARFEKAAILSGRAKGLLAVNDEVLTSKFDKLAPILKKISEKSMFFGYFKGTNNLNVENDAKPLAADIFGVDYLVDADPSQDEMEAVLAQVKEDLLVKKKKVIIAIRAYPNSISTIKKWIDENTGDTIQIAPISYFVTNN